MARARLTGWRRDQGTRQVWSPRGRTIKPAFFKDEQIAELDPEDRLLLIGLWMIADRKGRVLNAPKHIALQIFPYEFDIVDVKAGIEFMSELGLISIHQDYIQICNWEFWQPTRIREPRGSMHISWRQKVLRRDGKRCQLCGEVEQLEAHHIKSWAEYPALRDDLDNGITLCSDCHKAVHRGELEVS